MPVLKKPEARGRDHAFHADPNARLGRGERFRFGEWRKIHENEQDAALELYDYGSDPLETRNDVSELSEVVAEIRPRANNRKSGPKSQP